MDPAWTGTDLYDHLKRFMRLREKPDIFGSTHRDGALYQIPQLALEYFIDPDRIELECSTEEAIWFAEDILGFYMCHTIVDPIFRRKMKMLMRRHNAIQEATEAIADKWLDRGGREVYEILEASLRTNKKAIVSCAAPYFQSVANRMFHDRALCQYVSQLIYVIGIDGGVDPDGESPRQWIKRKSIPRWAQEAVRARDRGCCSQCHVSIALELLADDHIDHVLPLSLGGTNDLYNLQLLCKGCNLKKMASKPKYSSSVPRYIRTADGM